MKIIYNVDNKIDCTSAEEARVLVEVFGEGCVTKFRVLPNLPGRLPPEVHNSTAMWAYEQGTWWQYPIFGGSGRWHGKPE